MKTVEKSYQQSVESVDKDKNVLFIQQIHKKEMWIVINKEIKLQKTKHYLSTIIYKMRISS